MEFLGYVNFYYWLRSKLTDIRLFPREVKWKVQRMNRRFSDCDVWGFDYYLTDVILGGIKQLRNHNCGYPGDITEAEWNEILDSIIYTFTVAKNILNKNWYYTPSKFYNKDTFVETRKRFTRIFYVMTLEECKKYELGWRLFQERFFSLWS